MENRGKIKITLKRSPIGRPYLQKRVVKGLGLSKLHQSVIRQDSPELRGMIRKIIHLVVTEEA